VTPPRIIACEPIHTSLPIVVFAVVWYVDVSNGNNAARSVLRFPPVAMHTCSPIEQNFPMMIRSLPIHVFNVRSGGKYVNSPISNAGFEIGNDD
jgi:hypothetical protein